MQLSITSLNSKDYDFAKIFGIITGIGEVRSGSAYFAGGGGGGDDDVYGNYSTGNGG